MPSVWTKDVPRPAASGNLLVRALRAVGRFLLALLGLVGSGLALLGRGILSLVSRSRVALAVLVVAVVVLAGGLVDFGLNAGKAYPGVHVGEVDASGKTADEIEALVNQTYAARLAGGSVVVYASEDAEARVGDEMAAAQDAALAEQLAVEEARANKLAWTADAASLDASVPARSLAEEALRVGREDGGLFARIGALFTGASIEPRADYGEAALEQLAADIDAAIGNPRVDCNVVVADGVAAVTDGHEGYMVDRPAFARALDEVLLFPESGRGSFVARAEHAPVRIGPEAAHGT